MAAPIVIELDFRNEPGSLELSYRRGQLRLLTGQVELVIALRPDQSAALARALVEPPP